MRGQRLSIQPLSHFPLYCRLVFAYLCSASRSAHQSEALPLTCTVFGGVNVMRSEKRDRKSQMELSLDSKSASMAESREKIFKYPNSKYLSLFYSRYRRKQSFSENRIQSYRLPMFAIL